MRKPSNCYRCESRIIWKMRVNVTIIMCLIRLPHKEEIIYEKSSRLQLVSNKKSLLLHFPDGQFQQFYLFLFLFLMRYFLITHRRFRMFVQRFFIEPIAIFSFFIFICFALGRYYWICLFKRFSLKVDLFLWYEEYKYTMIK